MGAKFVKVGEDEMKIWIKKWRLNAPENHRWTDEEVLFEKGDSLFTGMIIGSMFTGGVVALVLVIFK